MIGYDAHYFDRGVANLLDRNIKKKEQLILTNAQEPKRSIVQS